ncbi:MAG: hypothetical protein ABEJ95_07645 [Candidatus Nanohalobium sp.]
METEQEDCISQPPRLSEFDSLDNAIEAKIRYYKQVAEELAEDR